MDRDTVKACVVIVALVLVSPIFVNNILQAQAVSAMESGCVYQYGTMLPGDVMVLLSAEENELSPFTCPEAESLKLISVQPVKTRLEERPSFAPYSLVYTGGDDGQFKGFSLVWDPLEICDFYGKPFNSGASFRFVGWHETR